MEHRPTIVIGFDGGLGNQMYQYAAARALALRSGGEVLLDPSHYQTSSDRQFWLDDFRIAARRLTVSDRYRFGLEHFVPGGMRDCPPPKRVPLIRDLALNARRPLPKRVNNSVYLDGHWQHHQYFSGAEDLISQDFTLKTQSHSLTTLKCQLEEIQSVAVHVRRTDFFDAGHDVFSVCTIDYFTRAIRLVADQVAGAVFHVFSDDIDWTARNVAIAAPHVLMPTNVEKPIEDLVLMAACRHFIISNSTFSWWAAWLGLYPDKHVIAPNRWLTADATWDPTLPQWTRIPP